MNENPDTQARQILDNLLDNALRYKGQEADSLLLSTRATVGGRVGLQIWSDGAPLDKSVERHLFEPFFSSESRSSGLGLYICRQLCQRHGAAIVGHLLPARPVETGRLQEDHRIGIADGRQQQAVGAPRRGGHDDAQAREVGEQRLRALRMMLDGADAAEVHVQVFDPDHPAPVFAAGPAGDRPVFCFTPAAAQRYSSVSALLSLIS